MYLTYLLTQEIHYYKLLYFLNDRQLLKKKNHFCAEYTLIKIISSNGNKIAAI